MIGKKPFSILACIQLVGSIGCGTSSPAASGSASIDPGGTGGAGGTSGQSGQCGAQAQTCCETDPACGSGLTCSDHYCLTCGPAPASFMGCTNAALTGTASAASAPDAGTPDDPHVVIDNDICTRWNYGDYGNANAYWQVDLGTAQPIEAATIWPNMTPADAEVQVKIEYKAADADAFTPYPSADGEMVMLHDYQPWLLTFSPPLNVKVFRVTIVNTPSFAALREVGLYTGCAH